MNNCVWSNQLVSLSGIEEWDGWPQKRRRSIGEDEARVLAVGD